MPMGRPLFGRARSAGPFEHDQAESEATLVGDALGQHGADSAARDRSEVATNIELEKIGMLSELPLRVADRAVLPLASAARIALRHHAAIQEGLQHIDDGVLGHAVAKRGCTDFTGLWVVDRESA
jgi:hypothetical protein